MAVAIAWLPGPAGTRRRVAKPSVEEPDAVEPARPDLWGARVSNDPGLPDRPAPALGVGDPEPARTALLSADAILFLERVTDVTRLLVDPARDGHDEELQHLGNRRQTGRAEQRLSAVTNVATRRASSVESARRTASIGFLDSTTFPQALHPR